MFPHTLTIIIASYSYQADHAYPHPLTITNKQFLRGASGSVTNASLVGGADYNMVSMLRVDEVLAWDGMTLYCEDIQQMSNLFNIGVSQLGKPVNMLGTYI